MAKRRSGSKVEVDATKAYKKALEHDLDRGIWITDKMAQFVKEKAIRSGVHENMLVGPFLATTSNCMGKSSFVFSESWESSCNIFTLTIATKGGGKTHTTGVFVKPLHEVEKKEMGDFDAEMKEKKKKKGKKDDLDDELEDRSFKFHPKTKMCDQITPEALIMALYCSSSGCLLICSDEFKGFHDRCVGQANMISSLCSAFSGESIRNTTIQRGNVVIDDHRLCILGTIQPELLCQLLNSQEGDPQGYWDRYLIIPGSEDHDVDIETQTMKIKEDLVVDLEQYLQIVADNHGEGVAYTASKEATDLLISVKRELKGIEEQSNYGNEVTGMTRKAFTQVQKVAVIVAAAREALEQMEEETPSPFLYPQCQAKFEVIANDVKAAYGLIKLSMHAYKCFKKDLRRELGEGDDEVEELEDIGYMSEEEITSDLILGPGLLKVKLLYDKVDQNDEILLSDLKRYKIWPQRTERVNLDVFVKALLKFKIATLDDRIRYHGRRAVAVLRVTRDTEDPATVQLFRLMFHRLQVRQVAFDPLTKFLQLEDNQSEQPGTP